MIPCHFSIPAFSACLTFCIRSLASSPGCIAGLERSAGLQRALAHVRNLHYSAVGSCLHECHQMSLAHLTPTPSRTLLVGSSSRMDLQSRTASKCCFFCSEPMRDRSRKPKMFQAARIRKPPVDCLFSFVVSVDVPRTVCCVGSACVVTLPRDDLPGSRGFLHV